MHRSKNQRFVYGSDSQSPTDYCIDPNFATQVSSSWQDDSQQSFSPLGYHSMVHTQRPQQQNYYSNNHVERCQTFPPKPEQFRFPTSTSHNDSIHQSVIEIKTLLIDMKI